MDVIVLSLKDFIQAVRIYLTVPAFIRDNKLWKGFANHTVVLLAIAIIGVIFGLKFVGTILSWWSNVHIDNMLDVGVQAATLVSDVATSGYDFLFAGAYKYIILIIMELLIFHMALRTNAIKTGVQEELTIKLLFSAQVRMIKVSIFTFIMEQITIIILSIIISILLSDSLEGVVKAPVNFAIQCFFLGFAVIDNFNEIRKLKIRESYRQTLLYPGAAAGIGMIMYLLILIPVVGPIVGPMTGAVAATLVMHHLTAEGIRSKHPEFEYPDEY